MKTRQPPRRGIRQELARRDGSKRALGNVFAIFVLALAFSSAAFTADHQWIALLHPDDFVVGPDLQKLTTRHHWAWKFTGGFEVAVRKSAIPIPAPDCRMDYLILTMPVYYPESPAQAPMADRQAVYDALIRLKKEGTGALKIRFDAQSFWRAGPAGPELTACNIYFTLPLEGDAAKISY